MKKNINPGECGKTSVKNNRVFVGRLAVIRCLAMFIAISGVHLALAVPLYEQHNLVSDIPLLADHTDANLANPWGIAYSPTGPFWIAENHAGVATIYNGAGQPFPTGSPLIVTIPPPSGGTPPSAPTGQVYNGGTSFEVSAGNPARFIFAGEDGTITGWNVTANATNAILMVDNSAAGAIYKGLAIGNNGSGDLLYAANFHAGTVDVFDSSFNPVSLGGAFTDPGIPSGFAPFDIQNIGGKLYVTYAKQDAAGEDDVAGAGNGYVDIFDTSGNLIQRLISNGPLNSPWGMAIAPDNFGAFSNDLLIGNFGDGLINAFDPLNGNFLGHMLDGGGNPLSIEGLWALTFGNGGLGGDLNTLYFTAGISGGDSLEDHGLFGSLDPVVPEPSSLILLSAGLAGMAAARRKRNCSRCA